MRHSSESLYYQVLLHNNALIKRYSKQQITFIVDHLTFVQAPSSSLEEAKRSQNDDKEQKENTKKKERERLNALHGAVSGKGVLSFLVHSTLRQ